MGHSPFSKGALSQQARANRRRSTRLDYETPIVLSGRDARGQPFREETVTLIVNFHGAKVRTTRQVLVGMLVTVESVKTGQSGKAVCVNVYEAPSGQTWHGIALQLVQPGNIWGVEDPPADWATVAAELGGPLRISEPGTRSPTIPLTRPTPGPVLGAAASRPMMDAQLADLEQRATKLIDSAVETLRVQTDLTVRDSLAVYEQRLAALVSQAEVRISQRVDQAASEVAASIETLRSDALAEMVQDTLGEFQKRVGEITAEQEARLSQLAGMLVAQTENRLNQAASNGTAHADSLVRKLEQGLSKLTAEADRRLAERAEIASVQPEAALAALEQRLTESMAKADRQMSLRADKAFAEFDAALATFRSDLDDELASRREQAVQSAEQALRSRVAAILSTIVGQPQPTSSGPPLDVANKK